MQVTIELPDRVLDALVCRARDQHSSIDEIAAEAIENGLAGVEPAIAETGRRIQLPLIRSENPGSLRSLTNAEIDEILGY